MEVPDDEYFQQVERLDYFYRQVKDQILKYQSPTIGLFPIETVGRTHCSNVRDCVYSAVSVWALALAYRKIDDDYGRTYELEQCAVKCMRGILYCYMRQADKVEQFKTNQSEENSLHASYHVMSGNILPESEHHLQIDSVSLYLLYLVQMISSGVQVQIPDATCTNCSSGTEAMVRCVDCQDYLCDACLNYHKKFKATKDHKVITMEDIAAGKVDFKKEEENRYCKAHGKLCEYYCETEKKVLCRDCVILNSCPAQHTRVSLKEAAGNLADDLRRLKSKCDDALEKCQEAVATTKSVKAELLLNQQAAKDSLSKVETQYVDLIRKRVKESQGVVDEMKEDREERIDQKQESLEQIERDFEKTSEDLRRVLDSESEVEILSAHSTLSSQLEGLLKCKTEAADKSLCSIKFEAATPILPPLGEITPREEWKQIGQFSTGDFDRLHGIDVNEDGDVVVCSWEKGVQVFSTEGKIKCTLYDSPGSIDVAVTQDQKYVSSPRGKCQLSSHDSTGLEISTASVTNMDNGRSNINSLAVDPSGRIIVAQVGNTISIHNVDGSVVSKFATQSRPYRLSATSNRAIVASINRGESLQLMDYSGGNVKIILPPPEIKKWYPGFVCCSQSEIFVSNENRGDHPGVFRFTSDGDYLGCVTTNVEEPGGIALSKCGTKVFVVDDEVSGVKIFQRP